MSFLSSHDARFRFTIVMTEMFPERDPHANNTQNERCIVQKQAMNSKKQVSMSKHIIHSRFRMFLAVGMNEFLSAFFLVWGTLYERPDGWSWTDLWWDPL